MTTESRELVAALGPGETGPVLSRHLRATSGPWSLAKTNNSAGRFIYPSANLEQPIAFVFDSVAENAEFLLHSWDDQRRMLVTILKTKAVISELARRIRESGPIEDMEGNLVYCPTLTAGMLVQLEEIGKI